MVGRDRSWSNFAMVMCLGKRVAVETTKVCGSVSEHFSRYIGKSYGPSIRQAGGMVRKSVFFFPFILTHTCNLPFHFLT